MQVVLVPTEMYLAVKEDALALLAPAIDLSGGRETSEGVWNTLVFGASQLWFVLGTDENAQRPVAALTTSIKRYTARSMLSIDWCGGDDMDAWHEQTLEALEKFAKKNGCSGMELTGRAGWKSFLRKYGWEAPYLICEKNFDKEALLKEKRNG